MNRNVHILLSRVLLPFMGEASPEAIRQAQSEMMASFPIAILQVSSEDLRAALVEARALGLVEKEGGLGKGTRATTKGVQQWLTDAPGLGMAEVVSYVSSVMEPQNLLPFPSVMKEVGRCLETALRS